MRHVSLADEAAQSDFADGVTEHRRPHPGKAGHPVFDTLRTMIEDLKEIPGARRSDFSLLEPVKFIEGLREVRETDFSDHFSVVGDAGSQCDPG